MSAVLYRTAVDWALNRVIGKKFCNIVEDYYFRKKKYCVYWLRNLIYPQERPIDIVIWGQMGNNCSRRFRKIVSSLLRKIFESVGLYPAPVQSYGRPFQ